MKNLNITPYKAIVNSMRNAQEELSASTHALRKAIKELKTQRDQVLAINVNAEFAGQRVADWVEERVSSALVAIAHSPTTAEFMNPPPPEEFIVPPKDWQPRPSDMAVTLAYYLKDELTAAIRQRVAKVYAGNLQSITEDERADRLSKIDRSLLDAEMSEESIIRSAERAGFIITRRPDADPRAVLASDEVLP